jgi:ribosomal protein S21
MHQKKFYDKKKKNNYKKKKHGNQLRGLSVDVYNNNVDGALRILKKMIKESKLMLELKNREHYIKKSEKRRTQGKKPRINMS